MTTIAQIILAIALVLSIILPFGYYLIGEKNRGRYKTALGVNAFFFFGTMLIAIAVMFTGASSVQAAAGSEGTLATGMGYIAAALVTGLSCIGGGIAVASAASAALGAISEDQSILGKSLIFVGLAASTVPVGNFNDQRGFVMKLYIIYNFGKLPAEFLGQEYDSDFFIGDSCLQTGFYHFICE